jgi:hypothetical protein
MNWLTNHPRSPLRRVAKETPLAVRRLTAASCLCLALTLFVGGCKRYATVEPRVSEYAQALLGVISAESDDRLDAIKQKVSDDKELAEKGRTYLLGIIAKAEQGQWDAAKEEARRLMKDQIK